MSMPVNLAVTAAIWLLCSIFIPDLLPLDRWKIPAKYRALTVAAAIIFAPLAMVGAMIFKIRDILSGRREARERQRYLERINSVQFENARGMFDVGNNDDNEAILKIKEIIMLALERHASDIFIDPRPAGGTTVRIRANGTLHLLDEMNPIFAKSVVSAIKVVAQMDISEHRQGQDGAFSIHFENSLISFRVASVGAYAGVHPHIGVSGH